MYEYHIEGGFPIKGTITASGNMYCSSSFNR